LRIGPKNPSSKISGGGEIRTHGTLSGPPVFKTGEEDSLSGGEIKGCGNKEDRLGVLLGALRQIDPELASVAIVWQRLSPAIRAGILAMVNASEKL